MVCPKCGFDQPRDRFCAQCGVDISLYQPKTIPSFLGSKTFLIGLTSVGLCVVVVLGMIKFVKNESQNPDVGIAVGRQSPQKISGGTDSKPDLNPEAANTASFSNAQNEPVPEASETVEAASEPMSARAQPVALTQEPANDASAASPTASGQEVTSSIAKWQPTNFRLSFYEISFDSFQAALGISPSTQLTAGIIRLEGAQNSVEEKFKSLGGAVERLGVYEQRISFDEQSPNEFNFLSYDQRVSSEIGLALQLRVGTPTEAGMTVAIDGRRLIGKVQGSQVDTLPISKDLTLLPKTAIYMTGLIENRDPVDQNEYQSFLSNLFLSVFKSERFRGKQSGLVMVIEAETSAK
jgi:hypothetical protein